MMWETCRDKVEAAGSRVVVGAPVVRARCEGGVAVTISTITDGVIAEHVAGAVVASMSSLVKVLDPSRTLAVGRLIWSKTGAPVSDFEYFVAEGDETWSLPDT